MRIQTILISLALLAAAALARAESTDTDAITLGSMAERADAVVVAESIGSAEDPVARFRVSESLRGSYEAGREVRVSLPRTGHEAVALRAGIRYLLFLHVREDGTLTPIGIPWGVRDTSESAAGPLVDYARRYAAALGPDGTVAKPADLVALLVESLASTSSGVPFCAGTDLVRHQDLAATMTPAQHAAVDAAVVRPRKGDMDLGAIIAAAGVAGTPASDAAIVARLLDPATRNFRLDVTAALRRHARPEVVALLAAKLEGATPQQRADLVNAMGRLDLRETEPYLTRALEDAATDVRVEASHSLGLLARAVRAPKDGVDPEAPRAKLDGALAPLVAALAAARDDREQKALAWAVAQIDTQPAWDALRKIRDDEAADPRVREFAREFLLRPRVELIFDR